MYFRHFKLRFKHRFIVCGSSKDMVNKNYKCFWFSSVSTKKNGTFFKLGWGGWGVGASLIPTEYPTTFLKRTRACVLHVKMAKRGAEKELTQENWDQEDEEEEVSILFHSWPFILPFVSSPCGDNVDICPTDSRNHDFIWCTWPVLIFSSIKVY